jgi:hypothetical protein
MNKKQKELVKKVERALEREEESGNKKLRASVQKLLKELLAKESEKDALKEKTRIAKKAIEVKSTDLELALRGYRKSLPKGRKFGKKKGQAAVQDGLSVGIDAPASLDEPAPRPESENATPGAPTLT